MEGEAVAAQTAGFFPLVVVYIGNTGDGVAVGDDNQPGCASCKCRACAGAKHACGDTGDVYTIGDANTHKHAHGDPNTDAHGDGDINSIADAHSDANTHSILDPNAHTDAHTDAHPYLYTHRISHGNIHAYINTDGSLEIWRGYTHFLTIPQDDDCH